MCNKIDLLQQNFESAFQNFIHFRKNIIRIVKKHSILTTDLINTMIDTFVLVNNLHLSIINYETVIKNRDKNIYVQKKTILKIITMQLKFTSSIYNIVIDHVIDSIVNSMMLHHHFVITVTRLNDQSRNALYVKKKMLIHES